MLVKITKLIGGAAAVTGLLALSLTGAGVAHADTNSGSLTTLAVAGSDTTMDLMEGLSTAITINNAQVLSNYKATPTGTTISTRTGRAECTFNRPANSGDGRNALSLSVQGLQLPGSTSTTSSTGCVNVARSSSGGNPSVVTAANLLTYIPVAADAVTFGLFPGAASGGAINLADLQAIYSANGTPGSAACFNLRPLLPKFGSGSRSFFGTVLGKTDAALPGPWGTCVRDKTLDGAGVDIQEHDGRFLSSADQLIPYSVAQFKTETKGVLANDIHGSAFLGSIDFANGNGLTALDPFDVLNYGTATRPVFNVVPTAETTNGSTTQTVFVGQNSLACQQTAVIKSYGFAPLPATGIPGQPNTDCGNTVKKNT